MQSRKSDDDVDSIYELCPSLTSAQVLKLIKSYSADDCEERISPNFIEKLTQKLTSAGSVVRFSSIVSKVIIYLIFY